MVMRGWSMPHKLSKIISWPEQQAKARVFLDQKGSMLQTDIEKKIDEIGNQIFLKNNQVEKELFLENLSLFQWSLKKTFLKK